MQKPATEYFSNAGFIVISVFPYRRICGEDVQLFSSHHICR